MWIAIGFACVLLLVAAGCSQSQPTSFGEPGSHDTAPAWPDDWSGLVGTTVTLEGTAVNSKLGALLMEKENAIGIDGLDSWPEGYYDGGDRGKRLRVTGTVIKKDDVPAFVPEPGEPPKSGVPVQSHEELESARTRYLLKDLNWVVLDL